MSEEKARILLVDDDEVFSKVFANELTQMGFYVTQGYGRDVVAILLEHAIEIVILDIVMPGNDGLHVLEAVKADEPKLADPRSQRNPGELTPDYARNQHRSIKPEILVVVGICPHLGCSPQDKLQPGREAFDPEWRGGFYCPCHGSLFDLAGRVYKNKPAPDNMPVPPHAYLSESRILIGKDKNEKGA